MESHLLNKEEEEARSPSSFTSGLLLSTSVAVAGSFCYGFAHYFDQSKIMEEIGLSVADYSFFTSVMTLGGMITAAFSGKVAALVGRRQTMWISDVCFSISLNLYRIPRNGQGAENRVNISMDSEPQHPTNVTALLNAGTNVLQAI